MGRGKAVVLMGKNTMMRKAIRGHLESNPGLEKLLPIIKNNVGFVFTKEDLPDIGAILLENKVQAPARAGAVAPLDVKVPAQTTTLGPEKTSFFQALSIPTKITKGTIEILNEVNLIKEANQTKEYLKDPSKFAVAAVAAAPAASEAKKEEAKKEESEESDDDMGFGLFD